MSFAALALRARAANDTTRACYSLIKTPPLQIVSTIKMVKEPRIFHSREQDKVSFTARLTSLILQQYKIGFKVELKYIKSADC